MVAPRSWKLNCNSIPRWLPGQIPARKSYNTFNDFIDICIWWWCMFAGNRAEFVTWVGRTKKQTFTFCFWLSDMHLHVINICIYIYMNIQLGLDIWIYIDMYFLGAHLELYISLPVMFVSFLTVTFRVVKSVNAFLCDFPHLRLTNSYPFSVSRWHTGQLSCRSECRRSCCHSSGWSRGS